MEFEQSTHLWNWPKEPIYFILVWDGAEATGYLITTQTKRNLSSRSGIGGVLSAT